MNIDKTSLEAKSEPSCLGAVSRQLLLGEDMDGSPIFPHDIVLIDGEKKITSKN